MFKSINYITAFEMVILFLSVTLIWYFLNYDDVHSNRVLLSEYKFHEDTSTVFLLSSLPSSLKLLAIILTFWCKVVRTVYLLPAYCYGFKDLCCLKTLRLL